MAHVKQQLADLPPTHSWYAHSIIKFDLIILLDIVAPNSKGRKASYNFSHVVLDADGSDNLRKCKSFKSQQTSLYQPKIFINTRRVLNLIYLKLQII